MASLDTPIADPGGPSFFQSWTLRLSEKADTNVASPSISPSCVDRVARIPVAERSDLKVSYLPSPPGPLKHNAVSFQTLSSEASLKDVGQSRAPHDAVDSFDQRRTHSRISSNGSKDLKFFNLAIGPKRAEGEHFPSEPPSVAEVGQSVTKQKQGHRASLFSFHKATIDISFSNPACQPPAQRTSGAEDEQTAKTRKGPRKVSIFSPSRKKKSDPIAQAEDGKLPTTTTSWPSETKALERGSSNPEKHRGFKRDSRASSGIEALYDRSRRFLKGFGRRTTSDPASYSIDSQHATKVSELLDRVNSVLVDQTHHNTLRSPTQESLTGSQLGKARSPSKSVLSRSSSIQNLMLGKPPVNTPDSDALYGGPDDHEFFKVDISNPTGPTFLPSEARRIGTPPLPSQGPRGPRRSFFFDLNGPRPTTDSSPSDSDGDSNDSDTPSARLFAAARRRSAWTNDWFSVQLMIEDAREADEHFELNVPEHLLGSPLCPRSPMHKSGGNGVCVYHGRNR